MKFLLLTIKTSFAGYLSTTQFSPLIISTHSNKQLTNLYHARDKAVYIMDDFSTDLIKCLTSHMTVSHDILLSLQSCYHCHSENPR